MDFFAQIIGYLDNRISYVLIAVLLFAGGYFTVVLGFIQLRHFIHMFGVLRNSRKADSAGISSYQAFCTSMASRVGTGNVVGIAIAITLGGPGAIVWMWIIAILGTATAFAESALAQLFKQKDSNGEFRGGPAYYMEKGLNARWMGTMFSIFLIICYGFAFNAVQANTIAGTLYFAMDVSPWFTGILVTIISGLIILGGIRRIVVASEYIVPPMAIIYLLAALIIVIANFDKLPDVLSLMFRNAFGIQEVAAGGLGATIVNGIKRGLFSNEAGMGSAPNISASATPYPNHPASQGYVQMVGVFLDTIVICTASAAIVLLSGISLDSGYSGIELILLALQTQYGTWSKYILVLIILFFAFTSIIANYTYAENCFIFLRKKQNSRVYLFRIAAITMVMVGSVISLPLVWSMADISMSLMATTNLVAILLLSRLVVKLAKDYNRQRSEKKLPIFNINKYPEIKDKVEKGIWN